ncbi:glycerophosphodiester phosphodiesterase [Sporosarcina cyprini]|uniref:glycerophosphodiester phosphodiesterase n=1 Tax=Sporosarcina cyprini TaxID=2910523 RepID=UPI001EDDD6CF|nr:glycerophosphodiester phosphodiesterase family protein [Sporosarcina cyprini]MCG3089023.1 glycerophosphodiester phosphodiesterase [Sporosarcina cyprini]
MCSMSRPLVFAHRGASAHRFENTMMAFKEAAHLGADGLEIDVQITSDGLPVVLHDPGLQRVAGRRLSISSVTSNELQQIRIGKRFWRIFMGSRIPTLRETVSFCLLHQLALNIELKETVVENPESLPGILEMASLLDQVHFSSFDYGILQKVKALEPKMETALLLKKRQLAPELLNNFEVDSFHFHKRLWKHPFQEMLTNSGKILRMYGVTGKEVSLQEDGRIAGWITDFPERFAVQKGNIV